MFLTHIPIVYNDAHRKSMCNVHMHLQLQLVCGLEEYKIVIVSVGVDGMESVHSSKLSMFSCC